MSNQAACPLIIASVVLSCEDRASFPGYVLEFPPYCHNCQQGKVGLEKSEEPKQLQLVTHPLPLRTTQIHRLRFTAFKRGAIGGLILSLQKHSIFAQFTISEFLKL